MIDPTTLTSKDMTFLNALKAQGVPKEEAYLRLEKVRPVEPTQVIKSTGLPQMPDLSASKLPPQGPEAPVGVISKVEDRVKKGLDTASGAIIGGVKRGSEGLNEIIDQTVGGKDEQGNNQQFLHQTLGTAHACTRRFFAQLIFRIMN